MTSPRRLAVATILLSSTIFAFSTIGNVVSFRHTALSPFRRKIDIALTISPLSGERLRPQDIANDVKKEHTHILVLPGFATCTEDYTKGKSLVPNLIGGGGWNASQIHVVPCKVQDWAQPSLKGLFEPKFVAAMTGTGEGLAPDQLPYRWYLKRVATEIRKIDAAVKSDHGSSALAKIIIIGHSAGGWLARASVGFGSEHRQNHTKLDKQIGIDINNILAIVTLGTPNLPPPKGATDMTGGAQRITSERFPGAYFEDKLFYVSIAGTGIIGKNGSGGMLEKFAFDSYKAVAGDGSVDGDGITPLPAAHLRGADQITLGGLSHAPHLSESWYGSDDQVNSWFTAVLSQLDYIQNAKKMTDSTDCTSSAPEVGSVDIEGRKGRVEDYFRRRNALRYTGIWNKVENAATLEKLIFAMEELPVPQHSKVFSQGDMADAVYFVQSGTFACYEEKTGEIKAELGKNTVFGELGVLLGEQRYLSVRASTPNAVLYKLSKKDILNCLQHSLLQQGETIIPGIDLLQFPDKMVLKFVDDADSYGEYFEAKIFRENLLSCPIFSKLGSADINRLVNCRKTKDVAAGERIIEEGSLGGTMYFVADGSFECYRESSSQVLKVCEPGDYFGELGVIFEIPRAASVISTTASTVWELEGDTFLDCYKRAKLESFGAAGWIISLLKLLRVDRLARRVVPTRASSYWKLLLSGLKGTKDRVKMQNLYATANPWKGTRTHIQSALISIAIPLCFYFSKIASATTSSLSKVVLNLCFASLVFDNFVNASGKYLGVGDRLRRLCKLRSIFHGATTPLLFVPVIESLTVTGYISSKISKKVIGAVLLFSIYEIFDWSRIDIREMRLVDNHDSGKNQGFSMAGTLWYTSGKVLKNVIPAIILDLVLLVIGSILWKHGAVAGPWLLASGIFTFITSSLQRPDIQCYGEPVMVGLIWAAAARLPFLFKM